MLQEYAVEPAAIGSDWQTFRYLIEKFGFDQGRLISQFPKHWFREVYQAAGGLSDLQKKRIEEALNEAKKNKVVRTGRPYDPDLGGWLDNALAEHGREPFHAIIAAANPGADACVLCGDEVDEGHALMACARERAVPRDVESLAAALQGMLRFGARVVFVDPFFDPYKALHKRVFLRLLSIVRDLNPRAECEIHYRYHENKPDNADLEGEAAALFGDIIPAEMAVTLYCWKERDGGEDFHARYLLTDKGGIRVDAGFEPVGDHQNTDVSLMDFGLSQMRLAALARDATQYELVGPVLRISADGEVAHV
ncbi:hypothetical protein P7L79_27105 [Tistrella mobilis]|jgi:hypothetical protein|uniref:hypothetical protein n=1 Tax=Tistrella mobilis TaxID=171437 RepID=UPI003558EBC4